MVRVSAVPNVAEPKKVFVTVTNAFIASVASPVDSRTISAVVQGVGNAGTATINLIPTTDLTTPAVSAESV